jgi:alcohol dehydrogenase (cytochrome c)
MRPRLRLRRLFRFVAIALLAALLGSPVGSQDLSPRLENALGEWPIAAHGYDGNRYVQTTLITPANVSRLRPAWTFDLPKDGSMMEASPVVANGTLYTTSGRDAVYALDARTGQQRWAYTYPLRHAIALEANRGVALLDNRLFLGTLDGHVVALDAASGKVLWNVVGVHDTANSFYTMAPLAYGNIVMIGVSDGDWGGVGYVSAFDVTTGRRVWEWQTIPGRGVPGNETWAGTSWQRGGGAVWGGLTLDPDAKTLYLDVGNPQPDLVGTSRAGANLYTDSMVALDISTSRPRMKWYHQFVAHDTHDWDAAMPPVHFFGTVHGTRRDLLAAGDKGGNFWVLDAHDGSLVEHAVVSTQTQPTQEPSLQGAVACPGTNGGVQYNGGAYLPETNTFYIPSVDQCQVYVSDGTVRYVPGELYLGGNATASGASTGWLTAIDIETGNPRWRQKEPLPALGGALALSGGLVFTGQLSGDLEAYDARTGTVRWRAATGAPIKAAPAAYLLDGQAYVVVASGPVGLNFSLPGVPKADGSRLTAYVLR